MEKTILNFHSDYLKPSLSSSPHILLQKSFFQKLDSPVQGKGDQEYVEGSWTLWGSSRDRWDEVTPLKCLCNQAFQSLPVQLFFWKTCWMLISNLFKSSWEYNRDCQGINSPLKCWQPCCLSQWMKYWIYQSPIFHCSLHFCIFKLINHELCRLWYILWEHEQWFKNLVCG